MNADPVRVALFGAAGRMGQRVLRRIGANKALTLVAAFDRDVRVREVGDLALPDGALATADPQAALVDADVAIDFTAPAACAELLPLCAERGVAYVLASTALEDKERAAIDAVTTKIPVIVASNFSVGIQVMAELAELAARRLGDSFDVEISEVHHRHKTDAPSGTALSLAEAVQRGRGEMRQVLGRAGSERQREKDQLGIAALRGGDVSGEHTVYYFGAGERIELIHRATTPDIFADGALRAARWLVGQPPGCYAMRDLL